MGLFKKEDCALCGGKTGMLDKKIADGKICKDCREKLSPWFEDFKEKTAFNLEKQISARETEQQILPMMHFNKIFGEFGAILIDEEHRKFVAVGDTSSRLFGERKQVSGIEDVLDLKPDLLSFDDIQDVELDITQMTHEEMREVDGDRVSFDPPRFTYRFSFTLEILLDHPYVKRVRIPLNHGEVKIECIGRRHWSDPGRRLAAHLLGMPGLIRENLPAFYDNDSLIDWFYHSPYEMPDMSYGFKVDAHNWPQIRKYEYYLFMAQEIQRSLGVEVE